jgi:hypothetical protein
MLDIVIDNSEAQRRNVASIDNWPDPKPRAKRAYEQYRAAWDVLENDLQEAGLPIDRRSHFANFWGSVIRLVDVWEHHARRLERALLALMSSDALTDEQRAEVVAVLYGTKKVGRDHKTLTDVELKMIQHYRAADAAGKNMIRTMAKLAAGAHLDAEGVCQ